MPEWGIAIIGVAGVVVGVIITEIRHWLDRRQRFQVMTFEKRLKAHQEAFSLCYELNNILNVGKNDNEKHIVIDKVQKWWENNCLLLDEVSRQKIFSLTGAAYEHVLGYAEKHSTVFVKITETRNAIVRGIGAKHLPEMQKMENDSN